MRSVAVNTTNVTGCLADWVCVKCNQTICPSRDIVFGVFVLLPLPGPSEAESFQLEMSGLLSELACPYSVLTSGDITQRLLNRTDCLLLLSMIRALCNTSVQGATTLNHLWKKSIAAFTCG